MKENPIMRLAVRWNLPFMVVFALYTQTHGELGPGGGFQSGVIVAAAFFLYGLVFGGAEMRRVVPRWFTDLLAAGGVLLYVGTGLYSMFMGYEFLDHAAVMPSNPGGAEPWGMTLVEYGVGLTVFAVMMTIFNEITEGTNPEDNQTGESGADTEFGARA
ncbi:MAG: Na(+)/H(+) antiporter subunit B [Planctomycetes bacterium]|nr:Na(+)/H(+) antiporter subunit B [Planctomycetota bacterium]MCW8136447.1 Na(+)/H(+) antiporter subunit B [Planctomycetota bacterium]